eukprot:2928958-Lingulodinium_polyedra.AAC.1
MCIRDRPRRSPSAARSARPPGSRHRSRPFLSTLAAALPRPPGSWCGSSPGGPRRAPGRPTTA